MLGSDMGHWDVADMPGGPARGIRDGDERPAGPGAVPGLCLRQRHPTSRWHERRILRRHAGRVLCPANPLRVPGETESPTVAEAVGGPFGLVRLAEDGLSVGRAIRSRPSGFVREGRSDVPSEYLHEAEWIVDELAHDEVRGTGFAATCRMRLTQRSGGPAMTERPARKSTRPSSSTSAALACAVAGVAWCRESYRSWRVARRSRYASGTPLPSMWKR